MLLGHMLTWIGVGLFYAFCAGIAGLSLWWVFGLFVLGETLGIAATALLVVRQSEGMGLLAGA